MILLYRQYIKKFTMVLLIMIMLISTAFATSTDKVRIVETESGGLVELHEVVGGNFIKSITAHNSQIIQVSEPKKPSEIGIADTFNGAIDFWVEPIMLGSTAYEINYKLQTNKLVNGVFGDLTIKDTSYDGSTFYSKPYSKNFNGTTLYYGTVGMVTIPSNVSSVKISFKNTALYVLDWAEWVYGINLSEVQYLN